MTINLNKTVNVKPIIFRYQSLGLIFPEAILVRQEGGLVVSDSNQGGVHLFASNLDYVEFIPIPNSASITSLAEWKDGNIVR